MRDTGLTMAWALTAITIVLLLIGASLYVLGQVGWAQTAWVVASGVSGAAVVLWVERFR